MYEIDLPLFTYGVFIGLGAGAVAGILAGLAGVGGGLIYVPVFYVCMPGEHAGVAVHVFASLVAVIITGFFSTRAHWRLGHVDHQAVKWLLPGLVIGASIGLWCTLRLPEAWVLLALAALDAWIAFDYGRNTQHLSTNHQSLILLSSPIGFVSGALGIGGGTMLVPLLRRFEPLRFAIGTSALCGLMMTLGAVMMNVLFEDSWYNVLNGNLLFLTGTWLGIMLILPKSSGWSARLHTSLAEPTLRFILKAAFVSLSAGLLMAVILITF